MRKIIVMTFFMFIFLAWNSKIPSEVKVYENTDKESQIRELEYKAAEEVYLFWRSRCEQLRAIHPPQNKDLMEAELKLKLSKINLDIAKIILD